jgi:hypothetical protein
MAFSVFQYASKMNPVLLARLMYLQQWRDNPFGKWVGPEFVTNSGMASTSVPVQPSGPKWTGAPIEVHEEFVKAGRTDMDIPIRNRLTGRPVYGDAPLYGKGERAVVTFRSIPINYTRKAYNPPTGMSEQIVKQYADKLIGDANNFLRQWWNDYHPGNFILTMLAGASSDLITGTPLGGRGIGIVSHPNFFCAGSGQVSYAGGRPGTAGYEASVEAALDGLTNTPEDKMSVGLVKNLRVEANRARINPIVVKGGFKFYAMWISDAQWVQLENDPDFKDIYKRLPIGDVASHPLLNSAVAYIGGVCIFVDMNLWGARTNASDSDVSAGTVEYGPAPTAAERAAGHKVGNWVPNESRDTNDRKIGFLVGQQAMSVGVGKNMEFTEEIADHGFVKEIGINTIQSVVRSDVYDKDGLVAGLSAGQFHENTSSLVFATYSPDALPWA